MKNIVKNRDENNGGLRSHPRTIRDGAVAAAIGVSLSLAMTAGTGKKVAPKPPVDTPWILSSRDRITSLPPGLQAQRSWGIHPGWNSAPGKWRVKR